MRLHLGLPVAICCLLAQSQVPAQRSAQHVSTTIEVCATIGKLAEDAFVKKRDTGQPSRPDPALRGTAEWPLYEMAAIYGSRYASSESDAYGTASTLCLDNIERLTSRFKVGWPPTVDAPTLINPPHDARPLEMPRRVSLVQQLQP